MKRLAATLSLSTLLAAPVYAKGLDQLQPDTPAPTEKEEEEVTEQKVKGSKEEFSEKANPEKDGEKAAQKHEEQKRKEKQKEPEVPVPPGFQNFYVGAGLSLMRIEGDKGSWHSSSNGDIELGYKLTRILENWDVWGTFRYRPADVTVDADQRSYRGVVNSYIFGAKGQMALSEKLFVVASGELGASKAYLKPIDGLPGVVGGLEKSGVDLILGGGVSYLVLDKIAVGTQLHLGFGGYKSTQFGVDVRFLF